MALAGRASEQVHFGDVSAARVGFFFFGFSFGGSLLLWLRKLRVLRSLFET